MKGNRKTVIAAAALAVAAVLMLGLWHFTMPRGQAGEKTIVVQVVHGDQSTKDFTYHTGKETLGEVLVEEKLAEGEEGPSGLFVTVVDGEEAQDSLRQWWCVTKDGEMVQTGVSTTPIADGDHFELTMSTY